MSDMQFYNVPLQGRSSAGSKLVRRLAMPFFARLTTILEAVGNHLHGLDRRFEALATTQSEDSQSARHTASKLDLIIGGLDQVYKRLDHIEERFDGLNGKFDGLNGKLDSLNQKLEGLNGKFDGLNGKFDNLNDKFEGLNGKFDSLNDKFEAMLQRQSQLEEDISSVKALHWDHIAIARRLGQLEDRLIDSGDDANAQTEPDEPGSSIPFPGFERLDKEKVG